MDEQPKKIKSRKALVIILELLALIIFLYLVFLPIYPVVKYEISQPEVDSKDVPAVQEKTKEIINRLPENIYVVSPNRLIITKIGVNAPIVQTDNEAYGLSKGAWLLPNTSTPDQGGNTVITGHRFKYLPPHNLTFYLFHKLEVGDIVSVIWQSEYYYYKIKEIKIVPATELSILEPTEEPTLTLFTCEPIYSTKSRLVVVAELLKE